MNVTVCGGGVAGLSAGLELSRRGHRVTLIEKHKNVGGLSGGFVRDGESIPFAPHQCFKSDRLFAALASQFNAGSMVWLNSKMGIADFKVPRLWQLTTATDLLRFGYLSPLERTRLAIFSSRLVCRNLLHSEKKLDGINAKEWFDRQVGKNVTAKLIAPMVSMKFGIPLEEASLSYLVARLWNQNVSARGVYGYPTDGIQKIWDGMAAAIEARGGAILKQAQVVKIEIEGCRVSSVVHVDSAGTSVVSKPDAVVNTMPIPVLRAVTTGFPEAYSKQLERYRYTAYIGYVVSIETRLGPCLITLFVNSFLGGMNEFSAFGVFSQPLLYVFKYLRDAQDPVWARGTEELFGLVEVELRRLYPQFEARWWTGVRTRHAAVVHDSDYFRYKVDHATPVGNLFHAGMHVIYPDDRIMENSIRSGYAVAELI